MNTMKYDNEPAVIEYRSPHDARPVQKNQLEEKNVSVQDLIAANFGLTSEDTFRLNLARSQFYYSIISPLSTGIDLIADEFQSTQPLVFDRESKEFSSDEDVINLLNHPNSDQTLMEFFGDISRFYQINGNAFIIGTGNTERPPLEIAAINPVLMTIERNSKDMYASRYIYQSQSVNIVFDRLEEAGRFRFVNRERNLELWHIRDFTVGRGLDDLWGLTRLNAIFLEIDQYFSSNKHNLSLLKKGIRSSGILSSEERMTPEQRDYLREQINQDYAGDVNAGRMFLLDGAKLKFEELSKSLKDMDFRELKKDIEKAIYNRLKVPLPLVLTDNQKFDNINQGKLSLYDNAVIPLISKLYGELTLFLFPRFKIDIKEKMLWFNVFDVQVLRERFISNVVALFEKNIITLNQARQMIQLGDVNGGDTIYQQNNLVPLGFTQEVQENSKALNEALKKVKYKNGDSVYDHETIYCYGNV